MVIRSNGLKDRPSLASSLSHINCPTFGNNKWKQMDLAGAELTCSKLSIRLTAWQMNAETDWHRPTVWRTETCLVIASTLFRTYRKGASAMCPRAHARPHIVTHAVSSQGNPSSPSLFSPLRHKFGVSIVAFPSLPH